MALANKIDKFLGLMGAVLCAPLALMIPALVHLKLSAKTNSSKSADIFLVIISLLVLFFSTGQSLANWNDVEII